jgi:ribosomal 50S subunit-recycling heat shock protein
LRIDQFLSVSRLIKRRTQAKLACDQGLIYVDGVKAKPSKEIKAGQKVVLNLTRKKVELEVLKLPSRGLRKDEAKELYCILSEEEKKGDDFFEK